MPNVPAASAMVSLGGNTVAAIGDKVSELFRDNDWAEVSIRGTTDAVIEALKALDKGASVSAVVAIGERVQR